MHFLLVLNPCLLIATIDRSSDQTLRHVDRHTLLEVMCKHLLQIVHASSVRLGESSVLLYLNLLLSRILCSSHQPNSHTH